ncbi:hypothetical protein EAH76_10985 [Sphingomonas glacialis]|uniref:Uncharacterized protein n=1 Tax=Sphingomonas glacialis TaxID=658225 RepID=A0A502FZT7_9SPHN|nr:hypothetical protein EAH76_10985 [Sphingomonas glacialis]
MRIREGKIFPRARALGLALSDLQGQNPQRLQEFIFREISRVQLAIAMRAHCRLSALTGAIGSFHK